MVSVSAPTRICDLGGWTDTWFAGHGAVCHLAVWPGVDVTLQPIEADPGLLVCLHNFSREWHWTPAQERAVCPDPLVAACLRAAPVREGAWRLDVSSRVPPGASMGTSASVCVAILAALDAVDGAALDVASLARRAHRVETDGLHQQSGVQDQWAASAGGINLLRIAAYPEAECQRLDVSEDTRRALESQVLVVLLGRAHHSSAVHGEVVRALQDAGPDDTRLDTLRRCASEGADALTTGDLSRYGEVLTRNTAAQASLHPSLVSEEAHALIALAAAHDALGWKVNGAGGNGGSLTVLARSPDARARLTRDVHVQCPWATVLDVTLARDGVRIRES